MIIGVSGKIGSGKDEFFKTLNELRNNSFENKKFAYKLKQIICLIIGCTMEQLETEEFKDSVLPPEWNYIEDGIEKQMTVRLFLQKLGTEGMRDAVHKNIHINALFADYKLQHHSVNYGYIKDEEKGLEHRIPVSTNQMHPDWCVTDMRFHNELDAVESRDGITVRIERLQTIDSWIQSMKLEIDFNKHLSLLKITKNDFIDYISSFDFPKKADFLKKHSHPSETSLDNEKFAATLYNDGTLEDFKIKVKRFLHDFKL